MRFLLTTALAFAVTGSVASAATVSVSGTPAAVVSSTGATGFNSALTAQIDAIGSSIRFTYADAVSPGSAVIDNNTSEVNVTTDLTADSALTLPDNDINEFVRFTNNVGGPGEFTTYKIDLGIDSSPSSGTNPFGALTVSSFVAGGPGVGDPMGPMVGDPISVTNLLAESGTLWFSLINGSIFDFEVSGLVADGNTFSITVTAVPVPAAGLLFGSALLGAAALRRRKLQQKLGLPQ